MYLVTSTKTGISAKHLEREPGVSYKTAWRMLNLVRNELLAQDDEPLSGDVEADETASGARPRLGRACARWTRCVWRYNRRDDRSAQFKTLLLRAVVTDDVT
jgi:hypothetical protein